MGRKYVCASDSLRPGQLNRIMAKIKDSSEELDDCHCQQLHGGKGKKMYTDKERLDYLQKLTDEKNYTGKVILRKSFADKGWRLHETNITGAFNNVRKAIDSFIILNKQI